MGMKAPSIIRAIEDDLAAARATPIAEVLREIRVSLDREPCHDEAALGGGDEASEHVGGSLGWGRAAPSLPPYYAGR